MSLSNGWDSVKNYAESATAENIMEAETIGYLVFEDEDIVMLAQTLDIGNGQMLNAQVIAKSCISERYAL